MLMAVPAALRASSTSRIISSYNGNVGPWPYGGEKAMTDNASGDYSNSATNVVSLVDPVDTTGLTSCKLSFQHTYDTESGYDYVIVEVKGEGVVT